MARGEKEYGAKGMRWVDSKMKDGKGGFVKVRTNKPAEPTVKPKARPAAAPTKAKAAPAKPKMSATAKATGSTGVGAKAKAGSARSGAARSTANKVKPKTMEEKNLAALKPLLPNWLTKTVSKR